MLAGPDVRIYLTNTGALELITLMRKRSDLGNMLLADAFRSPKEGVNWALDNGAYSAWLNKRSFNGSKYLETLGRLADFSPPDFVVAPDKVASPDSLDFTMSWLPSLPTGFNYYLAVQDGMTPEVLDWTWVMFSSVKVWENFSGIFIGGTMRWKMRHAEDFIKAAHERGLLAHIGRVGTLKRLIWAARIKADSVDSSTLVQRKTSLKRIDEYKKQRWLNEIAD